MYAYAGSISSYFVEEFGGDPGYDMSVPSESDNESMTDDEPTTDEDDNSDSDSTSQTSDDSLLSNDTMPVTPSQPMTELQAKIQRTRDHIQFGARARQMIARGPALAEEDFNHVVQLAKQEYVIAHRREERRLRALRKRSREHKEKDRRSDMARFSHENNRRHLSYRAEHMHAERSARRSARTRLPATMPQRPLQLLPPQRTRERADAVVFGRPEDYCLQIGDRRARLGETWKAMLRSQSPE
ncbi:hypothetical protein Micbo1qcDRAFT_167239 [Microdochium bolleyi]|uniref:Uncharacterized protein n=1 Tax=Microdochium bolleyi TaxID=196109 RepID=A0A136IS22_9PEZI|nr:hypothetical protein Micbo1qcDRAFT_167239 [Microdochium bolleyi]